MDATVRVLLGAAVLGLATMYFLWFVPSEPEFKASIVTEELTAAVLEFTDNSEYRRYGSKDLGDVATSSVEAYLADSPGITLVSRDKLNQILEEQRLCSQGMCDPGTASEVGQLTGADKLVMGEIITFSHSSERTEVQEMTQLYPPEFENAPATRHEGKMAAQIQIVDTESGEILTGDVMQTEYSETFKDSEGGFSFDEMTNQLLLNLSQQIATNIGAESAKVVRYDLLASVQQKGDGWEGEPAERVTPQDTIHAVLKFSDFEQGNTVRLNWVAPDGSVHKSESISYLRSNWVKTEFSPPERPGRWTLELRYQGMSKPFGEVIFKVLAPSSSMNPTWPKFSSFALSTRDG